MFWGSTPLPKIYIYKYIQQWIVGAHVTSLVSQWDLMKFSKIETVDDHPSHILTVVLLYSKSESSDCNTEESKD